MTDRTEYIQPVMGAHGNKIRPREGIIIPFQSYRTPMMMMIDVRNVKASEISSDRYVLVLEEII